MRILFSKFDVVKRMYSLDAVDSSPGGSSPGSHAAAWWHADFARRPRRRGALAGPVPGQH